MKKLITLFGLVCIVTLGHTQTVNKNGKTTNNSSTTNKTTTNQASPTTNTAGKTSHSASNTNTTTVNRQTPVKNESTVANGTDTKPVKTVRFKTGNVVFKTRVEKDAQPENVTETENNSSETKGEIKKVAKSPAATDYTDRNKVSTSESLNKDVNNSGISTTDTSTTTGTKYRPSVNDKRGISCTDFNGLTNKQRQKILLAYEVYDLSEVKVCSGNVMQSQNKDDRLVVTCDEFSRSSKERKQHIINYPSFYNTDQLKNCSDYQEFIKK